MAPSNRVVPDGDGDKDGESKGYAGKKNEKTAGKAAAPAEKDQKAKGSPMNTGQARQQGPARLSKKGAVQEKGSPSPLGGGGPIGSRPPGPRSPVSAARCAVAVSILAPASKHATPGVWGLIGSWRHQVGP
jgi:hypothetical protein